MNEKIKVLIVDDSITYRTILKKIVSQIEDTEIVGVAPNGKIALRKTQSLMPDLILLDIEMPDMDGYETLKEVKAYNRNIEVVMISGKNAENVHKTLSTLDQGALDFIAKPVTEDINESEKILYKEISSIIKIVKIRLNNKLIIRKKDTMKPSITGDLLKKEDKIYVRRSFIYNYKINFVLIGVSTGGPNALQKLVADLSPEINCPILIVQHMPPVFTNELAKRLDKLTTLNVREAVDDESPNPGSILIAPGGIHMTVKKNENNTFKIKLQDSSPVNSCKPSVDVLFYSLSNYFGEGIVTVILTGMGADGANSVKLLRGKGAYSIIQDKESSTIWGMPGTVYENGDYDEKLPLNQIGSRISKLVLKR